MLYVRSNKPALFVRSGVIRWVDRPRPFRMMIVVTPFCEVVGEFIASEVGIGILKVNHNKLFMLIPWMQQW